MANFIQLPGQLADQMVSFVEVSSATVKRALDEVGVHRQSQEKAAALRPALLKHMLDSGVVKPGQKAAADVMLASHAESLSLLKSAVDKIAELNAEIARLKGGDPTKTAGDLGRPDGGFAAGGGYQHAGEYNSLTSPHVGANNGELKESDRILMRGAGLTPR